MAFAVALTLYNLTTKVGRALLSCRQYLTSQIVRHADILRLVARVGN